MPIQNRLTFLLLAALACQTAFTMAEPQAVAKGDNLAELKENAQVLAEEIRAEVLPLQMDADGNIFRNISNQYSKNLELLDILRQIALQTLKSRRLSQIAFGVASSQGERYNMQDAHVAHFTRQGHLFAVFDGHRNFGKEVADFCAAKMSDCCFPKPEEEFFVPGFNKFSTAIDQALACKHKKWFQNGGTTMCACAIVNDRLWIANVGDSRLVLARADDEYVERTSDHRPHNPDERKRIYRLGGYINQAGYICGSIAMSRAIGDGYLFSSGGKKLITSTPDLSEAYTDAYDFFILACDGLWDFMTSNEAIDRVKNIRQDFCEEVGIAENEVTSEIASYIAHNLLVDAIYKRRSYDNVTIILVFFNHSQKPPPAPNEANASAKRRCSPCSACSTQ